MTQEDATTTVAVAAGAGGAAGVAAGAAAEGTLLAAGARALTALGGWFGSQADKVSNWVQSLGSSSTAQSIDQNKVNHIFGNADHNLEGVVKQFGSPGNAFSALRSATEGAVKAGNLQGTFQTVVNVGNSQVTVRGAVVNGAVKIGTAFIPGGQ